MFKVVALSDAAKLPPSAQYLQLLACQPAKEVKKACIFLLLRKWRVSRTSPRLLRCPFYPMQEQDQKKEGCFSCLCAPNDGQRRSNLVKLHLADHRNQLRSLLFPADGLKSQPRTKICQSPGLDLFHTSKTTAAPAAAMAFN